MVNFLTLIRVPAAAGLCLALTMIVAGAPAMAQQIAGVIDRQAGQATRTGDSGAAQQLATGAAVYVGDTIETGSDSGLVIRFIDSSELTLSANAEVVIDDLVFSTEPSRIAANRQELSLLDGVYRFVSGGVGRNDPDDFTGRTPVATIGIRGTEFVGGELTVGMPAGTSHIGFQVRDGAISVTNDLGGVTLDAPGEGTFIPLDGSAAPTPVRQWTEAEAAEADELLTF